jgi:hypothetical protein
LFTSRLSSRFNPSQQVKAVLEGFDVNTLRITYKNNLILDNLLILTLCLKIKTQKSEKGTFIKKEHKKTHLFL